MVAKPRVLKPATRSVNKGELDSSISNTWYIDLAYGKHPKFTENTYAVILKTKLEGGASKCYLVTDLNDHVDEYVRELNVFGVMEKEDFHKVIEYVKWLKINGIFRRVPNLLSVMEGAAGADESRDLYELVIDAVQNDPDAFPTISSDDYEKGVSAGVILDTPEYIKNYGVKTVGVTTKALLDILDMEDTDKKTARYLEIIRGWQDNGYLLVLSRDKRKQVNVKPCDKAKPERFYVFRMDGTGQDA